MKKPLIILSGPTASGKTKLSIMLAKKIGGEIISADSMQVYKGCDIGSAKISIEEMEGVKHHLIDVLEPTDDFNVATFKSMAKDAINEIVSRNHVPIIVGGTGFYIQSVLYDVDFEASIGENPKLRAELEIEAKKKGPQVLYERLKEIDEESAKKLSPNDLRRVIRAIEFYEETKTPISIHNEEQRNKESSYNFAYFVLTDERDKIYKNINDRVDAMISNGLVDEVKGLISKGLSLDNVSMHGLGYKEIIEYLNDSISLDEAIYRIKRDTRHFAKRQMTWFRRERDVVFLNRSEFNDEEEILEKIIGEITFKGIINSI